MIREPVVAGQFYPEEKDDLEKMIKSCIESKFGPSTTKVKEEKIFGVIVPHAGYVYSGPTACHSFKAISPLNPELAIVIGPNHYGIGRDAAISADVKWSTPLGLVPVDTELTKQVSEQSKLIEIDSYSHSQDHSLEVQIPMLQSFLTTEFKILPIILRAQDMNTAEIVGDAVSEIAKNRNAIIIGSSDFTHYEKNSFAHSQDKALIEPILKLDVKEFYKVLKEKKITACGYGAIASTMIACKKLGATRGELLSYSTSGDVSGNNSSVVGYAAIKFV
ncbi:MAG: MEMO1 family protein [Nitrosopumilus sp.]|uniref:MEMO1 family protein n=1 Tax=Nitrosopumilus sp. TaxID=2024843 RepID=UPI00247BE79E|nr:MEMO1 family protein [Nitrosopumilus sp.]MCV0393020.1 MEMO1 family protein [Nitrosopumilus sp.]